MAKFEPRSHNQITASMAAKMAAETPITDFIDGSVVLTLLEAAAQEDFQQYVQMLTIIRNFNLDTTEGEDLDNRASEFGLTRIPASPHSGFVTITDTRFTKIATKIYAGLPGPTSSSTVINVDDAFNFPASGSLYIGRGTANSEGPIAYSAAPVDNTAFWTITLDAALVNDHGTDETIVLSQFGDRTVDAGTEAEIPETDSNDRIAFEINQSIELLDGEDSVENVLTTSLVLGGFRVPANSIISFPNPPFTGAAVTNPLPFTNGKDDETDQELRDRIRDTIQSLSRGTKRSVSTGIIGLIDEATNSSIVSASIVPPVNIADGPTKVFIDNGRGLEPSLDSVGLETVVTSATGGEQFFQLSEFPISKSSLISQEFEPFNLEGGETLIIRVSTDEETFTFASTDFELLNRAEATEIVEAINNRSNLIEARTITDAGGKKVIINPRARTNENLQIDESSTAQAAMNFSTLEVQTLKLYKNDQLLTKDGLTASVLSASQPFNLAANITTTTDGDITVTSGSRIVTKSAAGVNPFEQLVHPGDYIKFTSDTDAFYIKVRTTISDTKLILEEEYPTLGGGVGNIDIWNSIQLEVAANGDQDETEVVSFSPNDFANPAQVLASEALVRMQAEINLSKVELAVNDTKIKVISEVENSVNSKMRILGGGASLVMGFNSSAAITGFCTFTGGNRVVNGTGTLFLSDLKEGQWIKGDSDNTGAWTKVESIESDTVLYLTEGYRGEDRIGESTSRINFGELSEGKDKDYTLNRSNGQIELETPLVANDSLTAGSINTRAFADSVSGAFDFNGVGATSELIVCIDGGFEGTVTTADLVPPFNNFAASNLIGFEANLFNGFFIEWITGTNVGETGKVTFYTNTTGELTTDTNFTNAIINGDKFRLCQVLDFVNATDFSDPVNATAEEVAAAINAQILGGKAEVILNNRVRVRTTNLNPEGKVQVRGGNANDVLSYGLDESSNQLTNLAFVKSQNSDRNGNSNAIGFTLGPGQNLVAIFDGDNANKTFSVNLEVADTVTTGGSGTFTSTSVGAKYTTVNFFNDFWIYWTSGANEGTVQRVTSYSGLTGVFTIADVFSTAGVITAGDTFSIVPRTAENVVALLNDFNTTTMSIVSDIEVTGISGDFVQISTKEPGSKGKVFITGGTANSIGIAITGNTAGAPVNDVTTNSIAGLSKGLLTRLGVDGTVTTGDGAAPFDTFTSTDMITVVAGVFTGLDIEFLTGVNSGHKTTISAYNNLTGEITLTTPATNAISINDTFRISRLAFISDLIGASSPFTVQLVDPANSPIDVSVYSPERSAAIRDENGLNFVNNQVEGVDGYKFFTGLIQKAQFTIDGLDRDSENFPGIGAAGTQFEVLPPVLVKIKLIIDVITEEGVSLSSVSGDVSNAITEYINSRKVGEDVILSEIVAAAQSVTGVFDVEVSNESENIVISDGELARIEDSDLVIG